MSKTATNLTTDQSTLLEIKHQILDPHNFLDSNWSTNSSVCYWIGVSCGARHGRVSVLDLSDMGLNGTIAPQLGNLSFLVSLNLSGNNFHGFLPKELAKLHRLKLIDLSQNAFDGEIPTWVGNLTTLKTVFLDGTSFQGVIPWEVGNLLSLEKFVVVNTSLIGQIPASFFNISSLKTVYFYNNSLSGSIPDNICFHLHKLEVLDLTYNHISGHIPSNIGECSNLQNVSLYANRVTGLIPTSMGNLTRLKQLYLSFNDLEGEIPLEIGNLISLEIFAAADTSLRGLIPSSIFNISSLKIISLENNSLSGKLPSMSLASNLEQLLLWTNNLSGNIPDSISNASKLRALELQENSLSGFIPDTLGNLTLLERLKLWSNHLTTKNPTHEWSFLSSLANFKNLRVISIYSNPLKGVLPTSITNLSASLEIFNANDCKIKGRIPMEIGGLTNIMRLNLAQNELSGPIPSTIGKLQNLQGLYLADNKLQGSIPYNVCGLEKLSELSLSGNMLQGSILPCLGDMAALRSLNLSSNKFYSTIPFTFWNLEDILILDLSSNYLNGSIPPDIGNLKVVTYLNLSRNLFSSNIPATIGGLNDLQTLSLSSNRLQGSIPTSLGDLTSLKTLDLSNNNLSGILPKSLERLSYLGYFNVAFNRLEGAIPNEGSFKNFTAKSFMDNYALCGSPRLEVPPCKNSTHRQSNRTLVHVLTYALPSIASIILIVTFIIVFKRCQNSKGTNLPVKDASEILEIHNRNQYKRLIQATDGFNEGNLLGSGSFGSVYKGSLSNGRDVAVKVFNLQLEGAFRSFDVECEVMQNILHRNLVKVISSCSCIDFKALVLEFMPNGSLEKWLYSDHYFLNIQQRINIMIDVASALEYLHLGHPNPVIHCDLKPSNVLLDRDFVAHVGDFGIAKLLGDAESVKQTMTLATIGYMAPEYGSTGTVSIKSDVYSYGILLIETFTRKKPTDDFFTGEMTMVRWMEGLLSKGTIDATNFSLLREKDEHFMERANCISSIMRLALDCSVELPEKRKDMKDVVSILKKIKRKFLNNIQHA
ncbi:hypothetical protein REPUB_Repub12eG0010400 [Reevesia pubescens]